MRVIAPFVGDEIAPDALARMVRDAYAGFDHPDVAPLKQLGDGGCICSSCSTGRRSPSRTIALQLVGRLFDHVLARRGERVTIIGATSGDTGSAAIEALRDRAAVDIFILHPEGPRQRGAAPPDDDGRCAPTSTTSRSKARSTIARTW